LTDILEEYVASRALLTAYFILVSGLAYTLTLKVEVICPSNTLIVNSLRTSNPTTKIHDDKVN
jgi:hypothetical protein